MAERVPAASVAIPNYSRIDAILRGVLLDLDRSRDSRRIGFHETAAGSDELAREGLRTALAELGEGRHG